MRPRKHVARFQATNAVEITLAFVGARMRSGPTSASEWHAIARALEAGARAAALLANKAQALAWKARH